MPVVHPIIASFTAGEISPRLYGRVDLSKYGTGARELFNFSVMPHGGARRRGGTRFIAPIKDSNAYARLVEFIFSTTQAYQLEFGPNYVRFFRNRGQIYDRLASITGISLGATTTITAPSHGFSNGDRVILSGITGTVQLNNREITVASVAANSFVASGVNSTGYGAFAGAGTASRIYELVTFYDAADIADLTFTQSADTLYIFHRDWPIGKLLRHAHANWTHEWAETEDGPFLDLNTDADNTISIDVASGSGIMTASKDTFEAAHVGAQWRVWEKANGTTFGYAQWAPGSGVTVSNGSYWEYNSNVYYVVSGGGGAQTSTAAYPTHTEGTVDVFYGGGTAAMRYEHSGYVVVRIDSVVDTKNANITVLKYRTPYTAYGARSSHQWQEGAWSDKRGYPVAGSFDKQRFVAGGSVYQPNRVWGSQIGAYLAFKDGDKDDLSYAYTIAADGVPAIKYLSSGKQLAVLTTSAECNLGSSKIGESVTPTNINISRETNFGTSFCRPLRIGPAVLFVQRAGKNENYGRKLREFVYNFQTDSFLAPDLTIISEHITLGGLVSSAYQATPDQIAWFARADGYMVGMTYERDQQVVGWHRHQLGGPGAKVKNIACIPGSEADEVWMIVERTVAGGTVRYIEWLQPGLLDDADLEDGVFVDSSLSYSGSAATTVNGLWHIRDETVDVLADGVPLRNQTVSATGTLTLAAAASTIHVGYGYTSRLKTLRIEAGAQAGSAQGRVGRVSELIVRFNRTVGGKAGPDESHLDPIQFRTPDLALSVPVPLFTGDKVIDFDGSSDRDRYIVITQEDPLPMDVIAVMPKLSVAG